MTQKENIIKASKGKVLFRKSAPDFYFNGCIMLEGETKADFGEILISEIPETNEEA